MNALDRELTIVIPSFANTPYLPAALESALDSTAASILIADDASAAPEQAIFARYASAFPDRVRVTRSESRGGIQSNLNRAIDLVRTAYFVRLDSDDLLYPGHVEYALGLLRERPELALVAGRERRIGEDEHLVFRREAVPAYPAAPVAKVMAGVEAFRFIVRWNPNPCSSGTVYRTAAVREAGGFDAGVPWADDWEMWLRLASRGEVAYVDAPSALYRIHPHSTTSQFVRQNRLCYAYDYVYRRAAELCPEPAFSPDLRRAFLKVARFYAGAALRQGLRPEGLRCGVNGVRALWTAAVV